MTADDPHLLARLDRIEDKIDTLSATVQRNEGRRHALAGVVAALVSLAVGLASVWAAAAVEANTGSETAQTAPGGPDGSDVGDVD